MSTPFAVLTLGAFGPFFGAAAPTSCPVVAGPLAGANTVAVEEEAGDEIKLATRDKLELGATYFESSKRGKQPGIVLVHDAGADKSQGSELAAYLQKKGISVLTVDLRGHGSSVTEKLDWAALEDERARNSMWTFAAQDVRSAVDWLRDQDRVHSAQVAVVGIGAGGSLAVAEALDDRDTTAVAMIAPASENFGFNLVRGLEDLGGLPTLILAGKDSRKEAERLQNAAHQANGDEEYITVTALKSASSEAVSDKRTRTELLRWLKSTLNPED